MRKIWKIKVENVPKTLELRLNHLEIQEMIEIYLPYSIVGVYKDTEEGAGDLRKHVFSDDD